MSTAATALAIVQAAAVVDQIVRQYRQGKLTDAQLIARWETMNVDLRATEERWKALEAQEK